MKYVALLRGINVGGNNKVDMKKLVAAIENYGFNDVSTYINSGNIFFSSTKPKAEITKVLEKLIKSEFGINIKVLVRDKENIGLIASSIPQEWKNDKTMKCDVMFLWEGYAHKSVLDKLAIKPVDDARYVGGAIIWKVDKQNVTRSGIMKLVGTDLYAHMTIRNCNTVRKIQERMS